MKISTKIYSSINGMVIQYHEHRIHIESTVLSVFRFLEPDAEVYYNITFIDNEGVVQTKSANIDVLSMTEEELFQLSLVWEYPIDVYLLRRIKNEYKDGLPEYNGQYSWKKEWEY